MKQSLWLPVACAFAVSSASYRAAAQGAPQTLPPESSDVLLIVDDSDPANVIFTATSNAPIASDTANTFSDGIDLTTFLSSPENFSGTDGGSTLTTFLDGTPTYDTAAPDDLSGLQVDLNLYDQEDDEHTTETFNTGSRAFTGTFTVDLSAVSSELPAAGTIGDVYAGYQEEEDEVEVNSADGTVLIGEYVVVPEPSSGLLLLLAGVALLAGRQVWSSREMAH